MRKKVVFMILLLFAMLPFFCHSSVSAKASSKQVSIIASHDLHSHLDSFRVVKKGKIDVVGGFARIYSLIKKKKRENPDTLVVDAGDFSMGTLYQTLYESDATELSILGMMGYDAVTLGNHEFDYGSDGLANMLTTAKQTNDTLPQLLECNVDWSKESGQSKLVKEAFKEYGGKKYTIIKKGDVSIAIFGIFGKDSLKCAPTCELAFTDPIASAKSIVAEIKKTQKADMIVCLSHSGTNKNKSDSEDQQLADAVPDIDLIISGHTHTLLKEPITEGNTSIVSFGEYGQRIGDITMLQKPDGRWKVKSYVAKRLDDSITPDETIQKKIDAYEKRVNAEYLADFGYKMNQILAVNPYEFENASACYTKHTETRIGDYLADSYIYSVNHYADDKDPVDVAVIPSGVIRDTLIQGNITVSDIFNIFSLGKGNDNIVGYPLVSVYLTGSELKTIAEIDASISNYMTSARLYMSGMAFTYNPNRLLLNKVTDVYLTDQNDKRRNVNNNTLYHVVTDIYSARMISSVTDISKGILSVNPKDKQGNDITKLEDEIIYSAGKELKAWDAIARYTGSFQSENGTRQIPDYYNTTHGRKVVNDSKNIWELVKYPNKYAVMIVSIAIIILIIFALIVVFIIKRIKKRVKF